MSKMKAQIRLLESVLHKVSISNPAEADCRLISEQIFLRTKNYISESSIKRLYGFTANGNAFSSLFILNSLSQFVGFESWEAFIEQE